MKRIGVDVGGTLPIGALTRSHRSACRWKVPRAIREDEHFRTGRSHFLIMPVQHRFAAVSARAW